MLIDNGNLDVYIPKKENEIVECRQKLSKLKAARIKFPKLRLGWDRWKNEYFYTPEVNAIADKVDFHYNCGCCADSPLLASCYTESSGMKIYGDPYEICIGEKNQFGSGDIPGLKWEPYVREKGFGDIIIEKMKEYFQQNPQEDHSDDDDLDVFKKD
jgi:hypothetical protein